MIFLKKYFQNRKGLQKLGTKHVPHAPKHSGALENLGINRDNGKWQICFLDYLSSIRLVAKLDSIVTCFLLV